MRRAFVLLILIGLAGFVACHRMNSKEAIEQAVEKHLHENSHLMLNSFTTHFQKVTLKGDTAEALVEYQSKNLPRLTVAVRYVLRRVGGEWQVISSSSAGGQAMSPANPHGGAGMESDTGAPPQSVPAPVPSH